MVLLDIGASAPGTNKEIYGEDADDGTRTRMESLLKFFYMWHPCETLHVNSEKREKEILSA